MLRALPILMFAATLLPLSVEAQMSPPPTSEARSQQSAEAGRLRNFERALNGVRFRYFDAPDRDGRRTFGLARLERLLRAEPDPRRYSIVWDAFARVDEADRLALVDTFANQDTDAGWSMLAWLACFEDGPIGDRAQGLLATRAVRVRHLPVITDVIEQAILSEHPLHAQRGALLAEAMDDFDAVPAMIVGQIWPPEARSAELGQSDRIELRQTRPPPVTMNDLFWPRAMRQHSIEAEYGGSGVISVRRREVGRHAVRDFSSPRFDRQRVFHRGGTHETLVRMTSRAWGQPTDFMGWDVPIWRKWYVEEFQPLVIERRLRSFEAVPLLPTP